MKIYEKMSDLSKLYTILLDKYTEQVQKLEKIKSEHPEGHKIQWIPHLALNSRMFTYDEYLQNIYHGGFCYEEKNEIMPHLVTFIAAYEISSKEDIAKFEEAKMENGYQDYLDSIVFDKIPFTDFLQSQLSELRELEYRLKIPFPPKRKNATRQQAKYRADKKEYNEKVESLQRCRDEVTKRIELLEQLKNELK